MNLYTKQKQTETQETNLRSPKGKGRQGKGKLEVSGSQTTIHKIDKQHEFTV